MGSGAEKMISAMAIRLALLSISSLPKGDIFVLDEPATELDEDSMEGFTRILDSVKDYFKNVILISHIDALKDVVDQQVIIEHRHGYAHVEV
jgi:DNA repair exonuclease SbcCD ATPase subunit